MAASSARTIVESTTEPAFAVRLSGEIVAWNASAERLLGFASTDVVGRLCHALLDGRDAFGNAYCVTECPVRSMVVRGKPISRFGLVYRCAGGNDVPVAVSALTLSSDDDASPDDGGEAVLVHVLEPRPLSQLTPDAEPALDCSAADDLIHRLTPRQIEILRLLAAGHGTQVIAARLFISEVTVRNHVENLLRKLDVHSRLEAVSVAHRSGLV